jgi:hypothetical protein
MEAMTMTLALFMGRARAHEWAYDFRRRAPAVGSSLTNLLTVDRDLASLDRAACASDWSIPKLPWSRCDDDRSGAGNTPTANPFVAAPGAIG